MRAFVLCAGRGERLRPLTEHVPKPLLPILGRPLLFLLVESLVAQGFRTIGLNAWYLKDQICRRVRELRRVYPDVEFRLYEEPELLGTCGALRHAASFFTEPTLVLNGDILTNFPLRLIYEEALRHQTLCLMFCHRFPGLNRLRIRNGYVTDFAEDSPEGYAYTGIQVVSPEWISLLPPERELVPAYRRLIARGYLPRALVATAFYWIDIGTPENYRRARMDLRSGKAVIPVDLE